MKNKFLIQVSKFRFYGILRLTFLVSALMLTQLSLKAQSTELKKNITMNNVTVQELVDKLGLDFKYSFFIVDEQIGKTQVSVDLNRATITQILDLAFQGKEIAYTISGKSITITSKKKSQSPTNTSKKITGLVTDEKGEPIIGASVIVKGSNTGTITNMDGIFTLDVESQSQLLVSYIGYIQEQIRIGAANQYKIVLKEDTQVLDELVVVGYGTMKKRDMIGSVATVKSKDISSSTFSNPISALQGRASGVMVSTSSGVPGAPATVRIRGISSINSGNDPLWIIDGIPVRTGSTGLSRGTVSQDIMSTINPADIESIDVLKDAAATSIYGSRGSNGVIIITTKSGKTEAGKMRVNVDVNTGVSDLIKNPMDLNFANTTQWFQILDAARANGRLPELKPSDVLDANFKTPLSREQALQINTNWFDVVLRQGSFKDANVSVAHSTIKGNVFASLSYRNDVSVNVGNDFDRITGRINADFRPSENLNMGMRYNFGYTQNYRAKSSTGPWGGSDGTIGGFAKAAQQGLPWFPIYDESNPSGYWNPGAGNLAVIANRDNVFDKKETFRSTVNVFAEYSFPFLKGLSLRSEASADIVIDNTTTWASPLVSLVDESRGHEGSTTGNTVNTNLYFKYNRVFSDIHSIVAVGGTEAQRSTTYDRAIGGRQLIGYNQEIGPTTPQVIDYAYGNMGGERYLNAIFGRADYKLLDKYIIGTSLRRDGSSTFSKEVRWHTFSALSAGWIISDEKFLDALSPIANLIKLRGSFGTTGNQSIPNDANLTILKNQDIYRYGTTEIMAAGSIFEIGNNLLTWESTDSYDFGLDFGLFNNRISGSIAYYQQHVKDMLLRRSVPISAGIPTGSIWGNIGEMKNYGVEFNISSVNVKSKNFQWTTDFNISSNDNKILKLTSEMEKQKGSTYKIGGRVGVAKMAEYAGIDPERGVHMIWEYDKAAYDLDGTYTKTGRKIAATEANVSAAHNQVVMNDKNSFFKLNGGLNNTISYKGFDLNMFFTYAFDGWVNNSWERQWSQPGIGRNVLYADLLEKSWTTPGQTDAKYPMLMVNGHSPATTAWSASATDPNTGLRGWWTNPDINNIALPNVKETYDKVDGRNFSKYLQRRDYVRLKTISMAYNLPRAFVQNKMKMQSLRVTISATNLLTFTNYTGFDPETSSNLDNLPSLKSFNIGVSAGF